MQLVNDRFYTWYNRVALATALLLFTATAGATLISSLDFLQDWGMLPIVGVIAAILISYGAFFYRQEAANNIWVATLFPFLAITLIIISLVHNSGELHSWFLLLWFIQVLASGMFGKYLAIGCAFLVTFYYVLVATGKTAPDGIDFIAIAVVGVTYALSTISIIVWRRLYIGQESQRISQLTGQLKGKQQQAEILIQSISDGIIVTDIEGKISLMNPAAAKMTGWPVEETLGIDFQSVIKLQLEDGKELGEEESPFDHVLTTQEQATGTLRLVNRDNTFVIISVVVSPIILPNNTESLGTVAVFRDVSASRAEENRRADFISTASHEMRTPVAAIEGYLALALNDKVSQVDAKARSYLEKAHESTQHLGKLFQDLLTSAKAEDGRLVNHPQVVEMGEYLQELSDGLRFAAEKKGLLMDFTIGASSSNPAENNLVGGSVVKPLYYTHIDPDRMREVITNLFDNAVKYTETGKIVIALTGNDDVIQLVVRDTGPGIPPEDVPHLFQKFYRVDNSATRTIGGTGLGLFICQKIIEIYHGRIWVESEVGQGSTFYINLPRLTTARATELQKTEQTTQGLQI